MQLWFLRRFTAGAALAGLVALVAGAGHAVAQSSGVPAYSQDSLADEDRLKAAAEQLRAAGKLVRETVLTNQFSRTHCSQNLSLARPQTRPLSGRELCAAARAAHLRIGWYFRCTKCNDWHLDFAGGYALTKDGVAATCFHVVQPPEESRKGYLLAADENGQVYPVTEILAASPNADVAIVRVAARNFKPLPLNTDVEPGDRCACFSDPDGRRGFYTDGVVNRFVTSTNNPPVMLIDVSADWAPGSSGSAVLDYCGNIIGHVDTIESINDTDTDPDTNTNTPDNGRGRSPEVEGKGTNPKGKSKPSADDNGNGNTTGPADQRPLVVTSSTFMNVHEAVSAREVLNLIRSPARAK